MKCLPFLDGFLVPAEFDAAALPIRDVAEVGIQLSGWHVFGGGIAKWDRSRDSSGN
jgi:hypothetical protein